MPEIEVLNLSTISDASIIYLRKLVTLEGFRRSPPLTEWIVVWCNEEAAARAAGSTERRAKHAIALPPSCEWSDCQMADGLEMSMAMSYRKGVPADLSTYIDRIAMAFVALSAERLRQRRPQPDTA